MRNVKSNLFFRVLGSLVLVWILLPNRIWAQCGELPSDFYPTTIAGPETSPAGWNLATTAPAGFQQSGATAGGGVVDYLYTPPMTGNYLAGNYVWTANQNWSYYFTGPTTVVMTLGIANPDGSGFAALAAPITQDVSNTANSNFTFSLGAVTLTNQVLAVQINYLNCVVGEECAAINSFMYFNTPVGYTSCSCPMYNDIEISSAADLIIHYNSQTTTPPSSLAQGPLQWYDPGFSTVGWGNAVWWPTPTGLTLPDTSIAWFSYETAAAGVPAGPPNSDIDYELIRHEFTLPACAVNIQGTLNIAVDDNSSSYMNGQLIQSDPGPTSYLTYEQPRTFTIPAGALVPGANYLAIENNDVEPSYLGYTYQLIVTWACNCATNTPTNTSTATPTNTVTNTATNTATNTVTKTPTNTSTSTVTNTATNTATQTATNTSTETATNTGTNTVTNTVTNTATRTSTATPTNTATATVTNTPTATLTNTSTNTATDTPLITSTFTNTPTVTSTNTPTNTATNTTVNTATNTSTTTATNTVTNTPTATATNTSTSTIINTATNTSTATATNTPTSTVTNTATNTITMTSTNTQANTATNTMTQTATNTPTMTATLTPTNTPVGNVTMAKQVSETTAKAGDTLTYSIGITVTGGNENNLVVTDVLPAGLTFVAYGTVPAGTTESTNLPTLKWTLPSPLAVGTYQLTYQAQVNSLVSGGILTNDAQVTYTGQLTPITSSVGVQITGLYTINVNIYNSAGEVVKTIPVKQYSQPINSITLESSNEITSLQGPGSTIEIYYEGTLIGTWDGSNNSGNPVTNGNYEIKVDNISALGVVTSVSQNATVNRRLSNITANIYNSAGEVVRTLYDVVDNATGTQMTNVNLSVGVMNLGAKVSGSNDNLQIILVTSGSPVTLSWDGTNNLGTDVTPGTYSIEIHWDNGQGVTSNITRSVLVTGSGASGEVIAKPNLLTSSQTMTTFDGTGVMGAWTLSVKIYTVAGELVKTAIGGSGTAQATWDSTGIASGIYIAAVEVQDVNGGVLKHQLLKILVLH